MERHGQDPAQDEGLQESGSSQPSTPSQPTPMRSGPVPPRHSRPVDDQVLSRSTRALLEALDLPVPTGPLDVAQQATLALAHLRLPENTFPPPYSPQQFGLEPGPGLLYLIQQLDQALERGIERHNDLAQQLQGRLTPEQNMLVQFRLEMKRMEQSLERYKLKHGPPQDVLHEQGQQQQGQQQQGQQQQGQQQQGQQQQGQQHGPGEHDLGQYGVGQPGLLKHGLQPFSLQRHGLGQPALHLHGLGQHRVPQYGRSATRGSRTRGSETRGPRGPRTRGRNARGPDSRELTPEDPKHKDNIKTEKKDVE
ncbi:hypothetical protein F5Y17DRAFT_255693 [Xylariaceae sp. FL0594]|nr:hypothetical protein F5Y17DRAFT_255693 [Xylariaceae sp. FL0594]